jgi:hypothetical protein
VRSSLGIWIMAITLNGIYRVAHYFARGDLRAATTRYVQAISVVNTGPGLNSVANGFAAAFDFSWQLLLDDSSQYQGATINRLWPTPEAFAGISVSPWSSGTTTGGALPPQVSGLLRLTLAPGERAAHGRMYAPFAPSVANDAPGVPSATYIANLNALGAVVLTPLLTTGPRDTPPFSIAQATFRSVLWDKLGGVTVIPTVAAGQAKWATQRRRSSPPWVQFSPFG